MIGEQLDTVLLGVIAFMTSVGVPIGLCIFRKLDNLCERISRLEGKAEAYHGKK